MTNNWANKILAVSGNLILIQSRFPSGEDSYYFLRVTQHNKRTLSHLLSNKEAVDLNEYGIILHSGWGEPSDEIKQMIKEKYGASE